MSTETLRIGIVGAKFAGSFHADVWKTIPGVEVTAIAEISEQTRLNFRKKYGLEKDFEDYKKMFEDPDIDIVDICVPNFLHARIAAAAMEAGKTVICEKPFATTLDEGGKIAEIQAKTGCGYFYAEDWIFAPALMRAWAIVEEGGIGEPFFFKGKEVHNGSHSPYAKTIEYCGGGSLIHVGIHPIGYFYHLFGMPAKVMGTCTGGGGENFLHKDFEGEDWGLGVLVWENGCRALVEGNYITTGGMDDKIEMYGEKGVIKVDLTFGSPLSVFSKDGYGYAVEKAEFTQGWTSPAVDEMYSLGYKGELTHFIQCIRGKETQARGTTAEAGFDVLRIIDALYRSNREERAVRFT